MTKDQKLKIEEEAEKLTNRQYLREGYFGGRAQTEKGVVVRVKYFDHHAVKQAYIYQLEKDGFGL